VLAPDYRVGFVVLAAGNHTTATVEYLADSVAASVFPAVEDTARAQAQETFGGTYTSAVAGLASNITFATRPDQPRLVVESWYSNGTDFLLAIAGVEGATAGVDVRLVPSGLVQQLSSNTQRVGFRAVIERANTVSDGGIFSSDCSTWEMVDQPTYGNIGLDELVFAVDDGKVVSVSPRALRATLKKIA